MAKPLRILHAVHRMDRGGIETWLMNILRATDRSRFRFDFMVHTTRACAYDDELRALGARLIPCSPPARPGAYLRDLERIFGTEGPFDAVHVHGSAADGAVLRAAARAGVPVRIMHSHNAGEGRRRLRSYGYRLLTRHWMRRFMTHGLGCSQAACAYDFGPRWRADPRCRVLYYGLDWEAFRQAADVPALRAGLRLPPTALVVGHVGRFDPQKNHSFWLEIARRIAARRGDAHFVLVGDGDGKPGFQEQVRRSGLAQRFALTGVRSDIPALLQGMDVFLFPSLHEGLPLALLEAQAAGLPCVVSTSITPETTVIEAQMRWLPLDAAPDTWAEAVLEMAGQRRRENHLAAWHAVAHSRFSITYCLDRLAEVYEQGHKGAQGRNPRARRGASNV